MAPIHPLRSPPRYHHQWLDNRGFLNAPINTTTGLTAVGAREYDPATGTFISLDPLLETADPEQLNGYDYASDNPVTHSDPTGLMRDGSDGSSDGPEPKGGTVEGLALTPQVPLFTHMSPGVMVQGDSKLLHEIGNDWSAEYRKHYRGISLNKLSLEQDDDIWTYVCNDNPGLCRPDVKTALRLAYTMNGPFMGKPTALMFSSCEFSQSGCGKSFGVGVVDSDGVGGLYKKNAPDNFAITKSDGGASPLELEYFSGCNSFSGDTPVLMANGVSKPIKSIRRGDEVGSAVPGGRVSPHEVVGLHVTVTDRDYVDVVIRVDDGSETVEGTAHHLYWDVTANAWTQAKDLKIGHRLQSADGRTVVVVGLRPHTGRLATYNLTVEHVHTYFVAGIAPVVLVHNDCTISIYRTPKVADKAYELENGPKS